MKVMVNFISNKEIGFSYKSSTKYNHLLSYSKINSTSFKKITDIKFYEQNDNFIVAFSQLFHSYFYIFLFSFIY